MPRKKSRKSRKKRRSIKRRDGTMHASQSIPPGPSIHADRLRPATKSSLAWIEFPSEEVNLSSHSPRKSSPRKSSKFKISPSEYIPSRGLFYRSPSRSPPRSPPRSPLHHMKMMQRLSGGYIDMDDIFYKDPFLAAYRKNNKK